MPKWPCLIVFRSKAMLGAAYQEEAPVVAATV